MTLLKSMSCVIFLGMTLTAAAEGHPSEAFLFADVSCDQVRHRAGAIMIGRTSGLSFRDAMQLVRKNELDEMLIDAAYAIPTPASHSDAFDVQEAFIDEWGERCKLVKGDQ